MRVPLECSSIMPFSPRLKSRVLRYSLLLMPLLALARGVSAPVPVVTAAPSTPIMSATRTWPRLDVPSLLNYELGQFADLSGRTVNVRAYGARGDGATNDTAAVQSAINAGNGGAVDFPARNFVVHPGGLSARGA